MKKFYTDVILIVMLVAVMNFHFLPKILHEILGVALAAALAVHITWNLRALRSLPTFYLAVDALLFVAMIAVTISGICISHHLFKDFFGMEIRRSILLHQLHHAIPFVSLILIGLHLGHNWSSFHQRLKNFFPVNPTVEKFFAAALIIVGLVGAYMDQLPDRLLMHHIFATPATQLDPGLYAVLIIGMLALFTAIGIAFDRLIKKI